MSDVAQLMRAANPVPDSEAALPEDEFDALLLLTQSRSGSMDVQELTKPVEPEKRRRSGWLVAAAAFAVVIAVGGAALLMARPADEVPPAIQDVTPTTQAAPPTTAPVVVDEVPVVNPEALALAEGLVEDINRGDYAAAGERISAAEEFTSKSWANHDENSSDLPRQLRVYEYWVLAGSELEFTGCKTIELTGMTRCTMDRTSPIEPFHPAAEENVLTIRMEGDRLVFVDHSTSVGGAAVVDERTFMRWLGREAPAARAAYLVVADPSDHVRILKEYVPLWRATLDE